MGVHSIRYSFGGGEIGGDMLARFDDAKHQAELSVCSNFLVRPQGPIENRPGTAFVRAAKNSAKRCRLIPFSFSSEQTMVLEFGDQYIRFHTGGATLMAGELLTNGEFASNLNGWQWSPVSLGDPYSASWDNGNGGQAIVYQAKFEQVNVVVTPGAPITVTLAVPSLFQAGAGNLQFQASGSGWASALTTLAAGQNSVTFTPTASPCTFSVIAGLGVTANIGAVSASQGVGPYELPTPYLDSDLFGLRFVQSADVLTIAHQNYAPRELRRLSAVNWQLSTIDFTTAIAAPTGVSASASGSPTNTQSYSYCVTAIAADGLTESTASVSAAVTGNLLQTGCVNTVSWSSSAGASAYNVFRLQGGVFGYIGQTTGTSIADNNIAPDMSKTVPRYDTLFASPGEYPAAVSYFEQRRCFAGSISSPQTIWMTRSGTESNMAYSVPVRDDDRVKIRVAAREANRIKHLVPLSSLLILTGAGEWRMAANNSDAITPTSVSVKPQAYIGASEVQPVVVNNTCLYAAARGGHVRELSYSWQASGFDTGDVSLRAAHLFDGQSIVDMAYSKAPIPVVWCVSSSGKLLGMTYVPEQQVAAWHQHETDGFIESCAVVAEGQEDALYLLVRRTVNGSQVRYIERMASRRFDQLQDAFFVDCGLTYRGGSPVSTISGLGHLEGKAVAVLADGGVQPQRVVSGGAITLDNPATVVTVGLPIVARATTLPFSAKVDNAFGYGRTKNVNKVWLRVAASSGIKAGPDAARLREFAQRRAESPGSPPALRSEDVPIVLDPSWGQDGSMTVVQDQPLPLTLLSMTLDVAVGG